MVDVLKYIYRPQIQREVKRLLFVFVDKYIVTV